MTEIPDDTRDLLSRWHSQDQEALAELIERDRSWLDREVSRRLGRKLRSFGDTDDFVSEVMLRVFRWTPRFVVSDRKAFRHLICRIVENTIRDQADRAQAKKRSLRHEIPLDEETVLDLDQGGDANHGIAEVIADKEQRAWLLLALDLSASEDQDVVLKRVWKGLSYDEIGSGLEISSNAARMRFNRALARIKVTLGQLRNGRPLDAARPSDHQPVNSDDD